MGDLSADRSVTSHYVCREASSVANALANFAYNSASVMVFHTTDSL